MSRNIRKLSSKIRTNLNAAVRGIFSDRGSRFSTNISDLLRELVGIQFEEVDWETRSVRIKIVSSIRRAIAENTSKPDWSDGLFRRLKSERRDTLARKTGSGVNARVEGGSFVVEFYANNKSYAPGNAKYGWNQFWAINNALYGRGPVQVGGDDVLALSFEKPRTRGPRGYENASFRKTVDGVYVDKNWMDEALEEAAENLVRSIANGRR